MNTSIAAPTGHDGRIKGFDGLRTIAVGLVILNHNFYHKFNLLTGGSGVRLFFVLSGFLIISILHRRRIAVEAGEAPMGREIRHFYENRLYRIWPVYFAALIFALATVGVRTGEQVHVASWISNFLFFGNAMMAYAWFDWRQVGVFWSVSVEEQFYLLAGLGLIVARARWHLAICCGAFLLAVAAAAITIQVVSPPEAARFSIAVGSLTNFGLIALGGIAALTMRRLPPKAGRIAVLAAAPALALYLVGSVTGYPGWVGGALFFLPALLIPVVLVGIVLDQRSWLVRLLDLPPVRYIGRISYGIYLFHMFIRFELLPFPTWFDDHMTVKSMIETAAAVVVAALSWHWFEKPILDFRDRSRSRAAELRAIRELAAV